MQITLKELNALVLKILSTHYTKSNARRISDVIMFAQLSGRVTHGLIRLTPGSHGAFVDTIPVAPTYTHKTKLSTMINGGGNPGMLIAPLATQEVIKLATKNGFGIVGTTNSQNSIGALTYYSYQISQSKLIGMIYARPPATMAAFGTTKAIFGTNPLAVSFPMDPLPLIFDMSSSAITYGAIAGHKLAGTQLPPNVAIDSKGNMTQDPSAVAGGAILPFDISHKGSGIALMVELLAGVWTDSSYLDIKKDKGLGNLFIAFSPELLTDLTSFTVNLLDFATRLQQMSVRTDAIRLPGSKSLTTYKANIERGAIEVDNTLYDQLLSQVK